MRYWEDIAVGETDSFGAYAVTEEEVLAFARKYDPQPFHLSDEAAAQTHFGRIAASGWHSCAMTMAMLVERMQVGEPSAGLGAAGIDALKWRHPVYPGDTLHCGTEVVGKRASESKPDIGLLQTRTDVFNQDETLVMTFVATILMRRKPVE